MLIWMFPSSKYVNKKKKRTEKSFEIFGPWP